MGEKMKSISKPIGFRVYPKPKHKPIIHAKLKSDQDPTHTHTRPCNFFHQKVKFMRKRQIKIIFIILIHQSINKVKKQQFNKISTKVTRTYNNTSNHQTLRT